MFLWAKSVLYQCKVKIITFSKIVSFQYIISITSFVWNGPILETMLHLLVRQLHKYKENHVSDDAFNNSLAVYVAIVPVIVWKMTTRY